MLDLRYLAEGPEAVSREMEADAESLDHHRDVPQRLSGQQRRRRRRDTGLKENQTPETTAEDSDAWWGAQQGYR